MGKQIIHASFDLKYTRDPESEYYDISPQRFNILNSISETIPINIISNQFANDKKLVISTNGVDGYGYDNTDFKLNPIYYAGQKIYFVCRLKTSDNFPIKNIPAFRLDSDNFRFSLSAVKDAEGNDVKYTLLDENIDNIDYSGGYFKGSIIIDEPVYGVKLYPTVYTPTFGVQTGESNEFNVHPDTGLYGYRKINEDNDQEQNYKDLRYQNILQDHITHDFFTNFLGEAVGDKNSSTDSLGIKIYEKISNFTANNADVNTSNVTGLLSMLESVKIDYETYNLEFPASLSRIVDNVSISLSLQKGNINYFNQDFDDKGQIISDVLGINKGVELPIMSTLLQTGDNAKPIVAYEKFSNIYTLLDTNLLSCYDFRYLHPETNTYALSDYSKYWGWGLVIPPQIGLVDDFFIVENTTYNSPSGELLYQNVLKFQDNFGRLTTQSYEKEKRDPSNIANFYTFYEYLSTPEGSNIQKFIDFDNPNTYMGGIIPTVTYSVTAVNDSNVAYTLSGTDRNGAVIGDGATINMLQGDTIELTNNSNSVHPIYIKNNQVSGTGNQVVGATGQGASGGTTVTWTPTIAGTYYYQCSNHSSMDGQIIVTRNPPAGDPKSTDDTYTGYLTSYSSYIGPGGVVDDIILNNLVTNTVFISGITTIESNSLDNYN